MPIYEWKCEVCGQEEELLQKIGDKAPLCSSDKCAHRDQPMRKKVSRTSFELKGGGWAKDGYN